MECNKATAIRRAGHITKWEHMNGLKTIKEASSLDILRTADVYIGHTPLSDTYILCTHAVDYIGQQTDSIERLLRWNSQYPVRSQCVMVIQYVATVAIQIYNLIRCDHHPTSHC